MYYKVYIKITESKKKRLLLFWLKSSALTYIKV